MHPGAVAQQVEQVAEDHPVAGSRPARPVLSCSICGMEAERLVKHHVRPRCKGGTHGETVRCCPVCASQVHMLFTEKELAAMTLLELLETEKMQKYLVWRRKHPGDHHRHRMSKKVRKWKEYHR